MAEKVGVIWYHETTTRNRVRKDGYVLYEYECHVSHCCTASVTLGDR